MRIEKTVGNLTTIITEPTDGQIAIAMNHGQVGGTMLFTAEELTELYVALRPHVDIY